MDYFVVRLFVRCLHVYFTKRNETSLCNSHSVCELRTAALCSLLFRYPMLLSGELAVGRVAVVNSCKYLKKTKYKNLDVYSPAFNPNWIVKITKY